MEVLTTAEAAEQAGVTVRQWHYWTRKLDLEPTRQLAGTRGTMLWSRQAVRAVAKSQSSAAA